MFVSIAATVDSIVGIASAGIAQMFIIAGLLKVLNFNDFLGTVRQIVGNRGAAAVAAIVAAGEVGGGIGTLMQFHLAPRVLIVLLACFTLAAFSVHWRKQRVECHCFGVDETRQLSPGVAIRSGIFAAILMFNTRSANSADLAFQAVYGLIALLLFLVVGKVLENHAEYLSITSRAQQ